MTRKWKTLTMTLAAAALLAPVASADRPTDRPAKGKSETKAKKKGHAKAKNAVFRGTVESFDADSVVVAVTSTNKWGRRLDDSSVEFTVADVKKLKVADTNGDGTHDLADFVEGDRVHVQARITKEQEAPLAARKLHNKGQAEAETEGEPEPTSGE